MKVLPYDGETEYCMGSLISSSSWAFVTVNACWVLSSSDGRRLRADCLGLAFPVLFFLSSSACRILFAFTIEGSAVGDTCTIEVVAS
mmetsp:Transcript_5029/g.5022  ORF Transcript_5029/g.5022 Transcript_5029/m.5022 type:complete len:87 (-) Transcript_5029:17-277(-)